MMVEVVVLAVGTQGRPLTNLPSSSYFGWGLCCVSSIAAPTRSKSRLIGAFRTVLVRFIRFLEHTSSTREQTREAVSLHKLDDEQQLCSATPPPLPYRSQGITDIQRGKLT